MRKRDRSGGKERARRLNAANAVSAAAVFGTGLVLLTQFHVGGGHVGGFLGCSKAIWLGLHKAAAILFTAGAAAHIALHRRYIGTVARKWGAGLSGKLKARTARQTLLFAASVVVVGVGFYLWAAYPGAALDNEKFHHLLDVHNIVGLAMLIGLAAHITGRWRRMKRPAAIRPAGSVTYMRGVAVLRHGPFGRHNETRHVRVDVGRCDACGTCASACPQGVLDMIDLRFHKHMHVSRAGQCRGCGKCVAACPNGAFERKLKAANGE